MRPPSPSRLRLCGAPARAVCGVLLSLVVVLAQAQQLAPQTRPADAERRAAWLDDGQAQARQALRLLREAAAHGLEPRHYRVDTLALGLAALREARDDAAAGALVRELEDAMLRYLADLHSGRTDSPYRQASTGAFDPAARLAAALAERRLDRAVAAAAPSIPLYARVRASLAHYRELSMLVPHWTALPPVPRAGISPGEDYPGWALLDERLRLLGDLAAEAPPPGARGHAAALAQALRGFQSRHGLAEDGVLGPSTLAALSVAPADRVDQLALTLERLRWLAPPRGRVVAVNLPAYRLWAFDLDDTRSAPLEMRVIVGKAARTPTPLFVGQLRYLEFNPYWNVPRSIALGEILPKLARDPAYLRHNDMELVAADGRVLAATGGQALSLLRSGAARIRQRPGTMNVLGEVKFAMPNPMNIYLHSTSSKELFARSRRDFSHGCIRVQDPAALAHFVLDDPQAWSPERVAEAMRPGPMRTVALREPVPVILFYATAIVDRNGQVLFSDDVYGYDAPLLRDLRAD